jgi:hypothetical protein
MTTADWLSFCPGFLPQSRPAPHVAKNIKHKKNIDPRHIFALYRNLALENEVLYDIPDSPAR